VTVSALCQKLQMTRQNYYARRKQRQRRWVDSELVVALVQQERQHQPRIGTRKLHGLLKEPLAKAGIQLGRDRLFELLRENDLLVEPCAADSPRTTNS